MHFIFTNTWWPQTVPSPLQSLLQNVTDKNVTIARPNAYDIY